MRRGSLYWSMAVARQDEFLNSRPVLYKWPSGTTLTTMRRCGSRRSDVVSRQGEPRWRGDMEQDEFSAFERQGWETVAQPYHSYFGELTTQSHNGLLDALEVRAGVQFLDVASGPGYLAAGAGGRGAGV